MIFKYIKDKGLIEMFYAESTIPVMCKWQMLIFFSEILDFEILCGKREKYLTVTDTGSM